ncbi:hypothetical protein DAQ1742_01946 [Dickeya aquatica]|uniref:Uncharacterized protein n=1 Tax=Dickeya aquatica TaxID=1401087 RepID=A0A375AAD9_9GAMM|nr:hypothetical protein DAQ1742_01946 [Dickeya aquatica]
MQQNNGGEGITGGGITVLFDVILIYVALWQQGDSVAEGKPYPCPPAPALIELQARGGQALV